MKLTIAQRVDAAIAASSIANNSPSNHRDPEVRAAPYRIISAMRDKTPDRDRIIGQLMTLGSAVIEDFKHAGSLGLWMMDIAEIEHILGLPPTKHGRTDYPAFEAGYKSFAAQAQKEFEASRIVNQGAAA